MFKWLNKIFHRKPSTCDNCDTCKNGCNKHVATEKELQDFMKYRGSLMDNEQQ